MDGNDKHQSHGRLQLLPFRGQDHEEAALGQNNNRDLYRWAARRSILLELRGLKGGRHLDDQITGIRAWSFWYYGQLRRSGLGRYRYVGRGARPARRTRESDRNQPVGKSSDSRGMR